MLSAIRNRVPLLAVAAIVTISFATTAQAGPAAAPVIVDPAGDANFVGQYNKALSGPGSVAGMDIVNVWLSADNKEKLFVVKIETAAPPTPGFFQLQFDLPTCEGYVGDLPPGASDAPRQGGFRINTFWAGSGSPQKSNGQCAASGLGKSPVTGQVTTVDGNVLTIAVQFNELLAPGVTLSNITARTYADAAGPAEKDYVVPR